MGMEFIRHDGPIQCANPQCNLVEEDRKVYYCFHNKRRISWVVCGKCGTWTRVSYGVEEMGLFPDNLKLDVRKIRDEFGRALKKYGTNW
jgi:hypothetical protein